MAPFNRDNNFGKRDFKRPGGGGGFGGGRGGGFGKRDFGPKEMHSATCAECGSRCEVPFKPNGEKPVYCSNCFKREERPDSRRSGGGGRDFGGGGRDFGGYDRNERPSMHEATCDTCGKPCEVPFKPTQGKPVYCNDCFGGNSDRGGKSDSKKPAGSNKEFEQLNQKLDAILKRLDALNPKKEGAKEQSATKHVPATKVDEIAKPEVKEEVKKVGKKPAAKKAVKKVKKAK